MEIVLQMFQNKNEDFSKDRQKMSGKFLSWGNYVFTKKIAREFLTFLHV